MVPHVVLRLPLFFQVLLLLDDAYLKTPSKVAARARSHMLSVWRVTDPL